MNSLTGLFLILPKTMAAPAAYLLTTLLQLHWKEGLQLQSLSQLSGYWLAIAAIFFLISLCVIWFGSKPKMLFANGVAAVLFSLLLMPGFVRHMIGI